MGTVVCLMIAHFFALLIPGPDFALIMATSVSTTRKSGVLASLGLACGLGISATLAAFVLPMFLEALPQIIKFVQLIGAAYLFYLAYKAFLFAKKLRHAGRQEIQKKYSATSFWVAGFICNLSNPKALLFFLSIFSVAAVDLSFGEKGFLVTAMFALTFLYFAALSFVFSSKSLLNRLGDLHQLQSKVTMLSGYIFLLFACLILVRSL